MTSYGVLPPRLVFNSSLFGLSGKPIHARYAGNCSELHATSVKYVGTIPHIIFAALTCVSPCQGLGFSRLAADFDVAWMQKTNFTLP